MPNVLSFKKAALSLFAFLLSCLSLHAAIETASNRLSGSAVVTSATVTAADNKYTYMQANTGTWYNVFKVASGKGRVRVGVDHSSLTYIGANYDYRFHLKIEYKDTTLGSAITIYRQLRAAYDYTASASYQDAALYEINSAKVVWIKVTVDSIYNNLTSTYVSSVSNNMFVEASTVVERYYVVDYTTVPSSGNLFYTAPATAGITDSNEVRVAWNYLDGAEEYDLEWTWVNNYNINGNALTTDSIDYDFAHNSTRITTSNQHYNIPVLFDKGWLLFRVRAVGRARQSSSGEWKRVYGKWTSDNAGSAGTVDNFPSGHRYQITSPHEKNKNWQYVGTFAEEGKKKEVISYYDGTLRNRQTVTKTSTDKKVLIGETFYDFQGRAAITALPAPLAGTDEELKFYDGFNRNDSSGSAAKTYSRYDFDYDAVSCDSSVALPMGIGNGASRYYSSSNTETARQQAWLPDAEKYPYAQVEYMPDNTGRIRRQSGVGPDHQLESDHETKYFYGQPFQEELDRLFGSEAGYSKHYNKTMTVDANKQISVTYMDQEGRTVATALAGTPPSNLQALTDGSGNYLYMVSPDTLEVDFLSKDSTNAVDSDQDNNIISPDGRTLTMNTQLVVASEQTYKFNYTLTGTKYDPACLPSDVCYHCVYDLNIEIRNQCGTVMADSTKTVGVFDTVCANSAVSFSIDPGDMDVLLPVGVYTVSKTLSVNADAMELYWENFLSQSDCVRSEQSFIDSAISNLDTSGCDIDCDTCGDYEFQSACEASYQMMLADVSPGGQYAEYLVSGSPAPSQYPVSVLNDASGNQLPMVDADWRHPQYPDSLIYYTRIDSLHYYEADGTTISRIPLIVTSSTTYSPAVVSGATITTVNGIPTVEPQDLADLSDFVLYWKSSWAKSLVIYHPEYVYFDWCKENMIGQSTGADTLSSDEYDSLMYATHTLAAAQALHLDDPLYTANTALNQSNCRDPYFRAAGQGSSQYNVSGVTPDACQFAANYQGSAISIWKMAKIATSCGNIYDTAAISACLKSALGIAPASSLPADQRDYLVNDSDWVTFRALYMSIKQHFQGERADDYAFYWNGYNGCIGNVQYSPAAANMFTGSPYSNWPFNDNYDTLRQQPCGQSYIYYQGKIKRFPNENDINPAMAAAWAGNPGALVDTSLSYGYDYYLQTGQCPQALALQDLINEINAAGNLKATSDSLYQYHSFSQQLYGAMVSGSTFRYPTWSGSGSSATLTASFGGTGVSCSNLTLVFPAGSYSWSAYNSSWRIENFSQLIATGSNSFTVVAAVDNDMNSATAADYIELSGSSGCFEVQCSFDDVCEPNGELYELVNLMNLLAAKGTLYTTSSPGDTLTSGSLGNYFNTTQLKNRFGTGSFYWRKISSTGFKIWDGTNVYPSLEITLASMPASVTLLDSLSISDSATATLVAHNGTSTAVTLTAIWHHTVNSTNYDDTWVLGDCGPQTPAACVGDEYQRRDDLQHLLNQLAVDDLLKSPTSAGSSLDNYGVFTSVLEAPLGFSNYNWVGSISSLTLTGDIYNMADTSVACTTTLILNSTPPSGYTWGDAVRITSVWADESNLFNGTAYQFTGLAWFPGGVKVAFTGTSCYAIRNCSVCIANAGNKYENFDNAGSSAGTSLTYTASCPGTNYYTLTNDVATLCSDASITGIDHTRRDSTGTYFFTEFSGNGAQTLWKKTTSYTAYTAYTFSVWYMDADTGNNTPVTLELWMGSTAIASAVVTDTAGVWKKLAGTWNGSATAGTDTLKIKTSGAGSVDSKLAIDDIGFYTIGCDPPVTLTPSPTYALCDSCVQNLLNLAIANAQSQYDQYIDSVRADFEAKYIAQCMGNAVENFNVEYMLNEYHYTLYYYDQGGNLVRTVPPAGVNIVDLGLYGQDIKDDRSARTANPAAAKTFFTAHTLVTTYSYNTLNQLVQQATPDGDTTRFWYDRLGRIVASQNGKQEEPDGNGESRYSYTTYDEQGRIEEVGELSTTNDLAAQSFATRQSWLNDYNYPDLLDGGAVSSSNYRYQVTKTYYDAVAFTAAAARMPSATQNNLRKRVVTAAIYPLYEGNTGLYTAASHYSYDIHGNVQELVQEDSSLRALDDVSNSRYQSFKYFEYYYDLVSGKVNEMHYQDGESDAFYYQYEYDADNRVTAAYTSTDKRQWDRDAKYFYYQHGPLARTEVGQNKVQGSDYAYTLHGWIKGVNSNALTATKDMGGDAHTGTNAYVPVDEYGYQLTYFDTLTQQDYTSITTNPAFAAQSGSGLAAAAPNLWNGNIKNMVTGIRYFPGSRQVAKAFRYDQLNRIIQAQSFTNYDAANNDWDAGGTINTWKENFSYDANGNILTLIRHGNSPTAMDSLNYHYYSNTNRLEFVDDGVSSGNYSSDVDDQSAGNYNYDKTGNLISDLAEEIDTIKWNVYGKIEKVVRTSSSSKSDLEFKYDAMGNRICKIVKPRNGSGIENQEEWTYTYYTRDAQGNTIAIYERDYVYPTTRFYDELRLTENHLYGSSRVGVKNDTSRLAKREYSFVAYNADGSFDLSSPTGAVTSVAAATNSFRHEIGRKNYELSNHLGNVLVTVSDMRTANFSGPVVTGWNAVVNSANDYYAFGSAMEGRSYSSANYRYGFNGQEKDAELGEGVTTAEFWEYDGKLGRRWNQEPIPNPSISNYVCFADNPVLFSDPNGDIIKYEGKIGFVFMARLNFAVLYLLSPTAREMIKELKESPNTFTIKKVSYDKILDTGCESDSYKVDDQNGKGCGGTLYFNFSLKGRRKYEELLKSDGSGGGHVLGRALGHELTHLIDYNRGTLDRSPNSDGLSKKEAKAVKVENTVYKELKLFDKKINYRDTYGGIKVSDNEPSPKIYQEEGEKKPIEEIEN